MRGIRFVLLAAIVALFAAPPVPVLGAVPAHGSSVAAPGTPGSSGPISPVDLLWLVPIFGAIKVKDAASVAAKWRTRAGAAGADYTTGVQGAGPAWEQGAVQAAGNYKDGVAQAAADGRFEKGIRKAGQAKYVRKASEVGAQRFTTGVGAAEQDMAQGIAPVLQAISAIELPPRRPKGDPGNMNRAAIVAARLRAMKVGKQ